MSTSSQPDTHDPNSLLYYAPRRLRDRANALRALKPLSGGAGQAGSTAAPEQPPLSDAALRPEKPFPEALRASREADPIEPVGLMRQRARRKEAFAMAARFAAVACIVGGIAALYVVYFAGSRDQALSTEDGNTTLAATAQSRKAAMDELIQKMSAPALAVEDSDGNINEPLPLGVKVAGRAQGDTVNLSGLPPATKLSTGAAASAGEWRVAVNDLPVTVVIPPRDYAGQMNIVAELLAGDGQSVLRSAVRLAWRQITPRPGGTAGLQPPAAPATTGAASSAPARQIDPKEIAVLIKRGEELASNGDIPAARLLLQRAAEARNARAAFELAATYDPIVIKQLSRSGTAPDLALARAWYQRARDWGSPEAPRQLEALASADR